MLQCILFVYIKRNGVKSLNFIRNFFFVFVYLCRHEKNIRNLRKKIIIFKTLKRLSYFDSFFNVKMSQETLD